MKYGHYSLGIWGSPSTVSGVEEQGLQHYYSETLHGTDGARRHLASGSLYAVKRVVSAIDRATAPSQCENP